MLKLCFVEVNFYVGVQFMLGSIFKSLDVNTNNGLANEQFKGESIYQQQFFNMAKEKLGIDAIY